MHKEEAVKSRNKHLQSGCFVLRVIARFYISCGISSPLGQCSKAFTTLSVANVQEPRFSPQIASAGAFIIIAVTEKLTTATSLKTKGPPIRI